MEKIREHYINPVKEHYVFLGALIILLTLLKTAFGENSINYFLMGLVCFAMVVIFLMIEFKVMLNTKHVGFIGNLYPLFFTLFFLGFFVLVYTEFEKIFTASLGILIGVLVISVFAEIRHYLILGWKKLGGSFLFKKTLWVIIMILLITGYFYALSWFSSSFPLTSSSDMDSSRDIFLLPIYAILLLGAFTLLIVFFFDLFKKEPRSYKISFQDTYLGRALKNWKK